MSWERLDVATARYLGATVAEEVIQTVCQGCRKANLDFKGPDFCPIQVEYGWDGEHESIQIDRESGEVRCAEHVPKGEGQE